MDDETAGTDRQIGGETREEHKVSGEKMISKIKELIHQVEREPGSEDSEE
jgi:hypothetical protein